MFYYQQFRELLTTCPNEKYDVEENHPMMNALFSSMRDVGCDKKDLIQWNHELIHGFKADNFQQLSITYMDKIDSDGSHKNWWM